MPVISKSFDDLASVMAPTDNKQEITTPGTTEFISESRSISVAGEGTVTFEPAGSEGDASVTVTFAAGLEHPFRARAITAATATGIVIGW